MKDNAEQTPILRKPDLVIFAHWPYFRPAAPSHTQRQRWFRHLTESVLPALAAIEERYRIHPQYCTALAVSPVWLRLLERETDSPQFRGYIERYSCTAKQSSKTIAAKMAQKQRQAANRSTEANGERTATLNSENVSQGASRLQPQAIEFPRQPRLSAEQADELLAYWDRCGGDLIGRLKQLFTAGIIDLIACSATAPNDLSPLSDHCLYAWCMSGKRELVRVLGSSPAGLLLSTWPAGMTTENDWIADQVGAAYIVREHSANQGIIASIPSGAWKIPLIKLHDDGGGGKVVDLLCEEPLEPCGISGSATDGLAHQELIRETEQMLLRHLHEADRRWLRLLERVPQPGGELERRAMRQAARELLLMQCGDCQPPALNDPVAAEERREAWLAHWGCFTKLCSQLETGALNEAWLSRIEQADDVFLSIEVNDFLPQLKEAPDKKKPVADLPSWIAATQGAVNVFMLTWEYPPKQVGGLACAVCDLAESLSELGWTVHVVTSGHPDAPKHELLNGVYVHRVQVLHSGETDFFDWTFAMNIAMTDHIVRWKELGGRIDLLHAHDWLVYQAAREIKISFGLPLLATIHATEWGRNRGGLHSDLSRRIHELEWQLTYEAARVFVCSAYMREEVLRIFNLPADKLAVFPNGVRLQGGHTVGRPEKTAGQTEAPWASPGDRIILFIGRLVYEKGVQTLLEAMPLILDRVQEAKLVIAGSGPLEEEARRMAAPLGDKVWFTGFADQTLKEQLFQMADVVVVPSWYEPFGIVALEAMSRGKPLVVSDTGGLGDIVFHGVDGYKALPGHAQSLAWHTAELLQRPELAAKMTAAAAAKLQAEYDWAHIAAAIAAVYEELTDLCGDRSHFAGESSSPVTADIY